MDLPNIFGMYECEGENEFKTAKAFFILDGKLIQLKFEENKIIYLDSILSNITTRKQSRISSSSPSYGKQINMI
jgi:hypothetical protein